MKEPAYMVVIKEGLRKRFPFASVHCDFTPSFDSYTIGLRFFARFTRWHGQVISMLMWCGTTITSYAFTHGPDASFYVAEIARDFEKFLKEFGKTGKYENKYYTKIEIPKYKTVYKYMPPHAYMKYHR